MKTQSPNPNPQTALGVLTLALVTLAALDVSWGSGGWLDFQATWNALVRTDDSSPDAARLRAILVQVRLPRLALAVLVGASLALAGVLMQALFHNPLAEPYVVGVSSGAALGAVLSLTGAAPGWLAGRHGTSILAFTGALGATLTVHSLARNRSGHATANLLLVGIAVGGILQAATAFLLIRAGSEDVRGALSWLMGSVAYRDWSHVIALAPYTAAGAFWAWRSRSVLDLFAAGEETAHHLGVQTRRVRFQLLALSSLLAGAAVAAVGIVAFVGLMVPHLLRMFLGAGHRFLVPASCIAGAATVLASDLLARSILPGEEIPIGIITGLLGSVFFLILIRHTRWPIP